MFFIDIVSLILLRKDTIFLSQNLIIFTNTNSLFVNFNNQDDMCLLKVLVPICPVPVFLTFLGIPRCS